MCWNEIDNKSYLSVPCELISSGRVHTVLQLAFKAYSSVHWHREQSLWEA